MLYSAKMHNTEDVNFTIPIIRNHGKQVYTVIRLSDGKAVRLSLRNELALPWPDPDVWPENAGWEELTDTILHAPAEQVFKIRSNYGG